MPGEADEPRRGARGGRARAPATARVPLTAGRSVPPAPLCAASPRSTVVIFAPAGGAHGERGGVDLPVGDVGRRELEDGLGRAGGVDRGAQRRAALGVPGELGGADEAAVVLRGDPHRVGRAAGDRGGLGAREVGLAHHAAEEACDGGDGRDAVVVLGAGAGRVLRERDAVAAVRRRVVERDGAPVAGDLRVARVGLQLEAEAPVRRGPQAALGAGEQRACRPRRRSSCR